ncbi:MAG: exonuclease domain-containing protein [Quadrisphaera sp.]
MVLPSPSTLPLWEDDAAPSSSAGLGGLDPATPLHEVDFLVLDFETTGASAATCAITEVGAVRVRGGQVVAELGSLVRPPGPIPQEITALTGISDAMVAEAPSIGQVLAPLLELLRGAVLVAHNAPFDVSFLRAACAATDRDWPAPAVIDTLRLARAVLARGEVRDHKLGTLARHLSARTTPTHRALDDARATVDVLHALLARVGSLGVTTLGTWRRWRRRCPSRCGASAPWRTGCPPRPACTSSRTPRARALRGHER